MADYIIIGAEGKKELESPVKNGQGLYSFRWAENEAENRAISIKTKPDLELITESGVVRTPRKIKAVLGKTYALTRTHFYEVEWNPKLSQDKVVQKNSLDLADLFSGIKSDDHFKRLIDTTTTTGWLETVGEGHTTSLLIALFRSDNFKVDSVSPGYLATLHLGQQPLSATAVLGKDHPQPTGPFIVNADKLVVVEGKNVRKFIHQNGFYFPTTMLSMNGNILSLSSVDGLTLCTDNKCGYLLEYRGQIAARQKEGKTFHYFSRSNFPEKGPPRLYLPSEATSSLIVKHKEEYYALFGTDGGKICVYHLSIHEGRPPQAEYKTTISLLSLEKAIEDADKEQHVTDLKQVGGSLSLILGNLYLRIGLSKLLEHQPTQLISRRQEMEKDYLEHLRDIYSLERICCVPHRATTWDILST